MLALLFFRGGGTGNAPPPVVVQVGGSGKPKYHWEVEKELQETLSSERVHEDVGQTEGLILQESGNVSLLAAQIELEKARRELETRRQLEKARFQKKSRVFADRQAEEAYDQRLKQLIEDGFDEDEVIFLMEALDD
jgi:hypothetical protein